MRESTGTMLNEQLVRLLFNEKFDLTNDPLQALFRYISLKHSNGGKIEPISLVCYTFDRGVLDEQDFNPSLHNCIYIFDCRKPPATIIAPKGYEEMDSKQFPINAFLSKVSPTRVFCDIEKRRALVCVQGATSQWLNLFSAILYKLLPWIYKDGKLPEDEIEIFKLFAQKKVDLTRFTELINDFCAHCDIRDLLLKASLKGWENQIVDVQIESAKQNVQSCLTTVSVAERELGEALDVLATAQLKLNSLERMRTNNDEALYEFFKAHKQLNIVSKTNCSDGCLQLRFSISDTLDFYDQEVFKTVFDNPNSPIGRASQEVKDVLWGVFMLNKGTIKVEAGFELSNLSSLRPVKIDTPGMYITALPHPHLYHYSCLGGNAGYILKYMKEGDWDLGIEQAIAAVKNINFGDSVVLRAFLIDLFTYSECCKCIIADNGVEMTPDEFLDYISDERKEVNDENKA